MKKVGRKLRISRIPRILVFQGNRKHDKIPCGCGTPAKGLWHNVAPKNRWDSGTSRNTRVKVNYCTNYPVPSLSHGSGTVGQGVRQGHHRSGLILHAASSTFAPSASRAADLPLCISRTLLRIRGPSLTWSERCGSLMEQAGCRISLRPPWPPR